MTAITTAPPAMCARGPVADATEKHPRRACAQPRGGLGDVARLAGQPRGGDDRCGPDRQERVEVRQVPSRGVQPNRHSDQVRSIGGAVSHRGKIGAEQERG
jgi:hypothetical protein